MIRIDLDAPKDCVTCPFYDDCIGICLADEKQRVPAENGLQIEDKKPDWCPCVEVKKEIIPLRKHIVAIWVDKKSIVYNEEA
jgi:hypothetical protein